MYRYHYSFAFSPDSDAHNITQTQTHGHTHTYMHTHWMTCIMELTIRIYLFYLSSISPDLSPEPRQTTPTNPPNQTTTTKPAPSGAQTCSSSRAKVTPIARCLNRTAAPQGTISGECNRQRCAAAAAQKPTTPTTAPPHQSVPNFQFETSSSQSKTNQAVASQAVASQPSGHRQVSHR